MAGAGHDQRRRRRGGGARARCHATPTACPKATSRPTSWRMSFSSSCVSSARRPPSAAACASIRPSTRGCSADGRPRPPRRSSDAPATQASRSSAVGPAHRRGQGAGGRPLLCQPAVQRGRRRPPPARLGVSSRSPWRPPSKQGLVRRPASSSLSPKRSTWAGGSTWQVSTYSGSYAGKISLTDAHGRVRTTPSTPTSP